MSDPVNAVLNLIDEYLSNEIGVVEFQTRFIPFIVAARPTDPPRIREIVYGTELCIAEFTNCDRTHEDFRQRLSELVNRKLTT